MKVDHSKSVGEYVDRYSLYGDEMVKSKLGDFVLAEDYFKLEAERIDLQHRLEEIQALSKL